MTPIETMTAFKDELTKIAGFSRIGRRPLRVSTLLRRSGGKPAGMVKMSAEGLAAKVGDKAWEFAKKHKKTIGTSAASIAGWELLRDAKRDWETGRMMRTQQGY